MKDFIQKIGSTFLAMVVLFSTMSFSVHMHYCGENLVDVGVFESADTCGMEMQQDVNEDACSTMGLDCCSDVEIVQEGQDDLKHSFENFKLDHQLFMAAWVMVYLDTFDGLEDHFIPFKEYSPPLLIRDIQILDQTFLI